MEQFSCTFTGHRPNRFPWRENESDPRCMALKAVLMEQSMALSEAGVTDYFTGGATGVDCWTAWMALELREKNPVLKLRCIYPR